MADGRDFLGKKPPARREIGEIRQLFLQMRLAVYEHREFCRITLDFTDLGSMKDVIRHFLKLRQSSCECVQVIVGLGVILV